MKKCFIFAYEYYTVWMYSDFVGRNEMVDLFNEIILARRIALVARIAAGVELEGEEHSDILSLLADLSGDLLVNLNHREQEQKSLYKRGCLSKD